MSSDSPADSAANSTDAAKSNTKKAINAETSTEPETIDNQSAVDAESTVDSSTKNVPSQDGKNSGNKKKSNFGKWLLFLLFVLLFVAAGVAGWYYAQKQSQQQISDFETASEKQMSGMERQLNELRAELALHAARQANMESAMVASSGQVESQLQSLADRVAESESTTSGDWVLAEAEYLLRIANQRLVTSQDVSGALEMMSAADAILVGLAYPELTEARRQLVADMTRLDIQQPVDFEGIYFSLDALLPQVSSLSGTTVEMLEASEQESKESVGWRKYWAMTVDLLRPYVVINSSTDAEPSYLISDEQEALIKSQVQLQIRQAQLAMMSGEPVLYESALNSAADMVTQSFVETGHSASLAESLRAHAGRQVQAESMDINRSVRALEDVVKRLARSNRKSLSQSLDQE